MVTRPNQWRRRPFRPTGKSKVGKQQKKGKETDRATKNSFKEHREKDRVRRRQRREGERERKRAREGERGREREPAERCASRRHNRSIAACSAAACSARIFPQQHLLQAGALVRSPRLKTRVLPLARHRSNSSLPPPSFLLSSLKKW